MLVDRRTYWQAAFLISKGSADAVKARGESVDAMPGKVQRRRTWTTRVIQRGQKLAQDNIIAGVLSGEPIQGPLLAVRLLDRWPPAAPDTRPYHRPWRAARKGAFTGSLKPLP